jgi:hypothetical protein
VGITLLVIFMTPVVLIGVWLLVSVQLAPWRYAHDVADMEPGIDKLPSAPPDTRVAALSGERIERFGFSVQLPWKEIRRDWTTNDEASVLAVNGELLTVRDPLSQFDRAGEMRLWSKAVEGLDAESLRTNYALMAAAMNAKPESVKWWKLPGRNSRDLTLLGMKSVAMIECPGAIYAVSEGEFRGFQQGDPSVAQYCVKLDLFDAADRHYQLTISQSPGARLTQAEINAVVASMRPISQK